MTVIRFLPGGQVRGIWDDRYDFRRHGCLPSRASRVEVITEGKYKGNFFVELSPIADLTGDNRFRVCLAQTFAKYTEAVQAEIAWLTEHWVLGEESGYRV